ncbi:hypothetical protein NR798_02575 [Archangium gephyra]|uniref:hypothetical protein n=1 Tax=Archangium gephyra TaxID=48 RepID=UPI0035D50D6F
MKTLGRAAIRLMLGTSLALSGCATVKQQAAVERMSEYAYPRPLEEIWPEVRTFVAEQGYPPLESPGQYVMISDWVTSFGENRSASSAERIYVRGVPLNRANSEVRIFRESHMTGNKGRLTQRERTNGSSLMILTADDENPMDYDPVLLTHQLHDKTGAGGGTPAKGVNRVFTRDLELELKLLRRLDPEQARQLEAPAAQ